MINILLNNRVFFKKGQLVDHCGPFYGTTSTCGLSETIWSPLVWSFDTDFRDTEALRGAAQWNGGQNGMSYCRYSRSSSSSTGGGRAEGISWISRLLSSVDCMGPSWCCCWLTHECVKPPSSSGWAVGATATTGDRLNEERSQWQRFTAVWEKLSLTNEQILIRCSQCCSHDPHL